MQAIDAALAPDEYVVSAEYTYKKSHNNTMTVDQIEYRALLDVAVAVQAHLYEGASLEPVERTFMRYSGLCDANSDKAREIAERDKAERDFYKAREDALREVDKALAALEREAKKVKVGFLLSDHIKGARAAVSRALKAE